MSDLRVGVETVYHVRLVLGPMMVTMCGMLQFGLVAWRRTELYLRPILVRYLSDRVGRYTSQSFYMRVVLFYSIDCVRSRAPAPSSSVLSNLD